MKTGIVTANDGLLLHQGPSKASRRLELIPMATQVEIDERETSGRWLRVKYNGIWGWAHADYLRVLGPPEPISSRIEWPWVVVAVAVGVIFIGLLMLAATSVHGRDLTLPDLNLTPGVATMMGVAEVCGKKWGRDARHLTAAMKRKVFRLYGLSGNDDEACEPDVHGRRCEVDHLISRELGGADDVLNAWPQPYGTQPWNAVRKDRVENRLHKEVCAGNITLEDAQEEIRLDYRIPYRRYFGEPK